MPTEREKEQGEVRGGRQVRSNEAKEKSANGVQLLGILKSIIKPINKVGIAGDRGGKVELAVG